MILTEKQHETFQMSLLMLFSFSLPLYPRLSAWVATILTFQWLISSLVGKNNVKSIFQPLAILFWGFYIFHLVGLFYTSDLLQGYQKLETKLPLFIFPLIFFSQPKNRYFNIDKILRSFVLGCGLATIYSFGLGVLKSQETDQNWLFYTKLSSFLGFHPTYYSMYLVFACFILLSYLVRKQGKNSRKRKGFIVGIFLWFLLFILLLSSRMTILSMILIFIIAFLVWMYQKGKLFQGVGISAVTLILFVGLLFSVPGLKKRTSVTIDRIKNHVSNHGVSDPRINLWSASFQLIKENPFLGVGTGNTQNELIKIYKERRYKRELRENYNPHNQYLQTMVTIGILAGGWLVILLIIPFYKSVQQKDYLYCLFISLIIFSFMAESVLQTQRGTLFFGFFHSLFFMKYLKEN